MKYRIELFFAFIFSCASATVQTNVSSPECAVCSQPTYITAQIS